MLDKIQDSSDPGDEVQKRFRYQHTYCTMLLVDSFSEKLNYTSLWCEHHEDILAKTDKGLFVAFQIKTRKAEIGEWKLFHKSIISSIEKFFELEKSFNTYLEGYNFVSNAKYYNPALTIQDGKKLESSPIKFIQELKQRATYKDVDSPFDSSFTQLCEKLDIKKETDKSTFFSTLQKINFVNGPSLDDFDHVISHNNIGSLDSCTNFGALKLDSIKDRLTFLVYSKSSMKKESKSSYSDYLSNNSGIDKQIQSKKIEVTVVGEEISRMSSPEFKYIEGLTTLNLNRNTKLGVLKQKMEKGKLEHYIDTMIRRSISTSEHLVELSYKSPEHFKSIYNQLISLVKSECDDAHLQATKDGTLDSHEMLQTVIRELKVIATSKPNKVHNQDSELLIGIAGLLTEDCKVWWSEKFNPTK